MNADAAIYTVFVSFTLIAITAALISVIAAIPEAAKESAKLAAWYRWTAYLLLAGMAAQFALLTYAFHFVLGVI